LEISTSCPICQCQGNSIEVFPATIDPQSFTPEVFSARRLPDRRHYRWVKCKECSLYRSDPISDIDLSELYKISTFDYSTELHGLRNSYRKIVLKTIDGKNAVNYIRVYNVNKSSGESVVKPNSSNSSSTPLNAEALLGGLTYHMTKDF
jgi:hypothetical protein